jgi:hypothetical protein
MIYNLISDYYDETKPNTLVYCHNNVNNFHFLNNEWMRLFTDKYTYSHKIYIEKNITESNSNDTYFADGVDPNFLEQNKNMWDFVMVPDCGGDRMAFI